MMSFATIFKYDKFNKKTVNYYDIYDNYKIACIYNIA